jgi:hypothetical protein
LAVQEDIGIPGVGILVVFGRYTRGHKRCEIMRADMTARLQEEVKTGKRRRREVGGIEMEGWAKTTRSQGRGSKWGVGEEIKVKVCDACC